MQTITLAQSLGRVAVETAANLYHALKSDGEGFWAVTVQANWRVIFRFEDGNAYVVDYLDYH